MALALAVMAGEAFPGASARLHRSKQGQSSPGLELTAKSGGLEVRGTQKIKYSTG